MTCKEPFVFNNFDNVTNDNSVIWEACKKELPNIMSKELTAMQYKCISVAKTVAIYYEEEKD